MLYSPHPAPTGQLDATAFRDGLLPQENAVGGGRRQFHSPTTHLHN